MYFVYFQFLVFSLSCYLNPFFSVWYVKIGRCTLVYSQCICMTFPAPFRLHIPIFYVLFLIYYQSCPSSIVSNLSYLYLLSCFVRHAGILRLLVNPQMFILSRIIFNPLVQLYDMLRTSLTFHIKYCISGKDRLLNIATSSQYQM